MGNRSRELTCHHAIGILILRLQVIENLNIRARIVAEPVVVVDPRVAEELHHVPHLLRYRRLRIGRHGGERSRNVRFRVLKGGKSEGTRRRRGGDEIAGFKDEGKGAQVEAAYAEHSNGVFSLFKEANLVEVQASPLFCVV